MLWVIEWGGAQALVILGRRLYGDAGSRCKIAGLQFGCSRR